MNAYGINSHVIASSRSVNESMGNYVADQTIRQLILTGKPNLKNPPEDSMKAIMIATAEQKSADNHGAVVIL